MIANKCYGIVGEARAVDGFADQSFLICSGSTPLHVLKVSPTGIDAAVLNLQDAILDHLATQKLPMAVPPVVRDLDGRTTSVWKDESGGTHHVRLLGYLTGEFACDLPVADAALLRNIGRGLAQLDRALLGFEHPAANRLHSWHLEQASPVCRDAPLDEELAALVSACLTDYQQHVEPALPDLRRSVIHGDVNDHNLLVAAGPGGDRRLCGLIDFGDAAMAPTVFELAIAMAYFMMGQQRPLLAAQEMVAAYHATLILEEREVALIYDLVRVRLCMSLCHAARARQAAPGNDYLLRSEAGARTLLSELGAIPRSFFTASLREACGFTPWPESTALAAWLQTQSPAPLIDALAQQTPRILDFTPRSDDLSGAVAPRDVQSFASLIAGLLERSGTGVGIGRYGEIRGLYNSEVFAAGSEDEPRTVHLGVDVFSPAGTVVYAPLQGTVHSFADNNRPLDYGPTIILEHSLADAPARFFTLYGHLARESLDGLAVGQQVRQGEAIASIGEPQVNGGWPAHLHFQLIGDMLGLREDFPGVARHSEAGTWKSLCPNPARFLGLPDEAVDADCGASPLVLARRRDACVSPSLSLSFREPIKVVRGRGARLYTEQGREILDLVNNVAHVGHAHPHVVAAIERQEALLNTNTRYLHDGLVSYAERLTSLLPDELDTCFLVCSGSEANDLALRLARAFTGGRDVVVVDGAYHGNLGTLVEISPYKFDGPGGSGRPRHVQVAAMPDSYNGLFAGESDAPRRYADSVAAAFSRIVRQQRRPAAFFCESALGCGGQIILPAGYLRGAFEHARGAGAVCVADEVQVGFGRLGRNFWAFEDHDVVPDILTLGKPIGNGYPLAAVITRREIAEAFANGMEYFNTFGGNPVACAAGHAVLDVLEKDRLQEHARVLGDAWLEDLQALMARHALIGDVRGRGLFIGIELVLDRESRAPAAAAASHVVEFLKDRGIQISIDGPRYNVLKIKPPMVISASDAARVVAALDEALEDYIAEAVRS